MPRLKAANDAKTVLVQAVGASDTTIYVQDVSKFPAPPFRITVDAEIMEVTAVDTVLKAFTVLRAQEGTSPATHSVGVAIENRWTAGTYGELVAMNDLTWTNVQGKPSTFPPSAHKSSHASSGSDALTPADIGAAAASDLAMHLGDYANPHQVKAEQVFAIGGIPSGTDFPATPANYTLFYRTDLGKLFIYLP